MAEFSTKSRIFDTVDSPKDFVVRIFSRPDRLMQPEMTLSPTSTSRGTDSPVSAMVSRLDRPSTIWPSRGIFSPGFTTMMSPISTSSGSTCSRTPSRSTLA